VLTPVSILQRMAIGNVNETEIGYEKSRFQLIYRCISETVQDRVIMLPIRVTTNSLTGLEITLMIHFLILVASQSLLNT